MIQIENNRIVLEVSDEEYTYSIRTRSDDGQWVWQARDCALACVRNAENNTWEKLSGNLKKDGSSIVFDTVGAREVELRITVDESSLSVSVDEALSEGVFVERMKNCVRAMPLQIMPGLFLASIGEGKSGLALPILEGVWIPASAKEISRTFRLYHNTGLTMGFWAVCREGKGTVMGICDHAYLQFLVEGGEHGLVLKPEFLRDPEGLALEMEIRFLESEEPIAAAKEFRNYEMANKELVPLSERMRANPALRNIVGGANIKFLNYIHHAARPESQYRPARAESITRGYRFGDVSSVCGELKENGIDRVMAIFWGWGKDGYDRLHPDILPANEWAGGDDGLAQGSSEIKKLGFSVGGHDNYQDIYQAASSFGKGETVAVSSNGDLHAGGFWAGGQCYIQCSQEQVRFAQRNLPMMKRDYDWNVIFIDTTTACPLWECYSPQHPKTREDDRRDKIKLMDYARSIFGVFGSETGFSWGAEYMDYWEGILGHSSDSWTQWLRDLSYRQLPLFAVVYRDILTGYHHQSKGLNPDDPQIFLRSLRSGQPPYYFFREAAFHKQHRDYIRKTYEVLAYLHRYTLDATVCEHQWLTSDGRIEKIQLTDGSIIVINMSEKSYSLSCSMGEVMISAYGFYVECPRMLAFGARKINDTDFGQDVWITLRKADSGEAVLYSDCELTKTQTKMLMDLGRWD